MSFFLHRSNWHCLSDRFVGHIPDIRLGNYTSVFSYFLSTSLSLQHLSVFGLSYPYFSDTFLSSFLPTLFSSLPLAPNRSLHFYDLPYPLTLLSLSQSTHIHTPLSNATHILHIHHDTRSYRIHSTPTLTTPQHSHHPQTITVLTYTHYHLSHSYTTFHTPTWYRNAHTHICTYTYITTHTHTYKHAHIEITST